LQLKQHQAVKKRIKQEEEGKLFYSNKKNLIFANADGINRLLFFLKVTIKDLVIITGHITRITKSIKVVSLVSIIMLSTVFFMYSHF